MHNKIFFLILNSKHKYNYNIFFGNMCGIWFVFDLLKSANKKLLYSNFCKIKHRGPDKSNFIEINDELGNMFIGFHRLAIMDNSALGDQPFILSNKNRTIYMMCNGEIYNYKELKIKYNIDCKSKSDCEIILYLYDKIGFKNTLKELIGEFAICIIDINIIDNNNVNNNIKVHFGNDRFGIRPLFYYKDDNYIMCSSELKGLSKLVNINNLPILLPSKSYIEYNINIDGINKESPINTYYTINSKYLYTYNIDDICKLVRKNLKLSVKMMLESDRPLGALLSGGLDSSLVVSIASKYLKKINKKLYTFSIGIPGSTDKYYAELVSKYCDTIHTHFELSDEEFLNEIDNVIYATETYDITTIRASTGQYLISKKISENTDIKVLLIGDGSDELTGGYLYFHKAPNSESVQNEIIRLLNEINFYDVLRADRGIAAHGLEARVPFLNHIFVDTYMKISPELKIVNMENNRMEKWLLRKSFEEYLPDEVLWRKKEAFSDGVSSKENSWYKIIQNNIKINKEKNKFCHCNPPNDEALYYRLKFRELFLKNESFDDSTIIPHFWLPKWVGDINEPSARILGI